MVLSFVNSLMNILGNSLIYFIAAQMGQAYLDHIQKYSPEYFAQGLQNALEYAMISPHP